MMSSIHSRICIYKSKCISCLLSVSYKRTSLSRVIVCQKGKSWVCILILHDVLTYFSVFSSNFKPYFLIPKEGQRGDGSVQKMGHQINAK